MKKLLLIILITAPLYAQDIGGFFGAPSYPRATTFANLGTPADKHFRYCTDCAATAPCTGSGTGAFAYRVAGAWNCTTGTGGVSGSLGATDNAVLRADGVGGATAQGSDLVTSDAVANVVTLSATATNRLNLALNGATSGTATLVAPAVAGTTTVTMPNASSTLPIFAQQLTFTGPTAARTITLPDAAFTVARTDAANTFTGTQTLSGQLIVTDSDSAAIKWSGADTGFVYNFATDSNVIMFRLGGGNYGGFSTSGIELSNTGNFGVFWGNPIRQSRTLGLTFDAAGVLQINGGTVNTTKGALSIIADANGSKRSDSSATELLTLSTSGTTTNTAGNLGVANSDIEAILARVTTTITTATNWSVAVTTGITSCTNAWVAIGGTTTAQTGLTAGTTVIFKPAAGLQCHVGTASTLTVTTTGTPGAGAIRLTPIVKTYTAPTS